MTAGSWLRATIGPYRLVEFVGAGGMGEVYRAVDTRNARVVAIKILTTARRVPALVDRFRNEARIHAALHHPNIARMYEFLDHEGSPCIVMEFVDGETFEQRIQRRGAPPLLTALALAAPVIDAVGYLHSCGVIHRDIKATNVKVASDGAVHLLDFGIAKGPGSPALTADGSVIGTLQSLAPEQLEGAPATRRSDIWSLGVLLYELVTGRHPFAGDGAEGITARIRAGRFSVPSKIAAVPPAVDRIIGRCLRVEPRDRYPSCEALLTDVRALLEPPAVSPTPRRPRISRETLLRARSRAPLAGAIGAAVASVAFLIWSLSGSAPVPPGPTTPDVNHGGAITPVALDTTAGLMRTITINTINGDAEVWRDGRIVGQTPYQLKAAIGEHISVVLRRPGYEDVPVNFDVTEGRSEYTVVMRPRAGGPSSSRPTESLWALGLAWFGLPWRRKSRPSSELGLTVARPVAHAGGLPAEARVVIGMATDPGCVRDGNEDTVRIVRPPAEAAEQNGLLALVCDGMGGHAAGETASRIAADAIAREYAHHDKDPGQALSRAVRHANRAVFDAAQSDPKLAGMGTTCTALVLKDGLAWCAHVGDSRCYLVRGGEIFLMTEDHSAVMALVREGALSRDEARQHPDKNVISRALGSHKDVDVTSWPQPFVVRPDDRFLLCSDGLYDVTKDEEVRDITRDAPPYEACARLVALARERGAPDNVSVIILALPENFGAAAPRETRPIPAVS